MDELNDWDFGCEMRILWQNLDDDKRSDLGDLIRGYFGGERAEKIINFMQSSI